MRTHRPDEVTDKEMAGRSDMCKTTESGVAEGRDGTEDGDGQLGQAADLNGRGWTGAGEGRWDQKRQAGTEV